MQRTSLRTTEGTSNPYPRRWSLPLSVLLLLALLVPAVPQQPAHAQQQPQPGAFMPAECPIAPIAGITIDCGYLTVAESRRNPTGATIQIAVAILRSPNPNPAADPMFFLAGGPGQSTLPLAPLIVQSYAPILAQRDIVLFDQRGTGYSQPLLSCPTDQPTIGPLQLKLTLQQELPAVLQFQYERLLACGERLRDAGIALEAYNSVESAADIEDLRRALGYEQINLLGASYGTRLALTAMRYRPETLRAVILDSTDPLQLNFQVGAFDSFNQSLNRLFAACASEPACAAAYPDLAATFETLITRLNAEAAQVPVINPLTGELIDYLPLTGVDFTLLMFQLFYSTPVIPILPQLITQTAAGDYTLLGAFFGSLLIENPALINFGQGMQIAVQCNEDVTFATARDFVAARDSNRRVSGLAFQLLFHESMLDICAAWGLSNPIPAADNPVRSDVPTLIIGGEFDPVTPVGNAEETADTLGVAYIVTYPRGGHSPSALSPCLANIGADFLADPLERPATACVQEEAPLPFVIPR